MIVSFKDGDTEKLAAGRRVKRFVNIEAVARRKLRQLDIRGRSTTWASRRATGSSRSRASEPASTASASTTSTGSASAGRQAAQRT